MKTNYVSLDKEELDIKCKELNDERNDLRKSFSKKSKATHIPYTFYEVKTLKKAIEEFESILADYYAEEDESI